MIVSFVGRQEKVGEIFLGFMTDFYDSPFGEKGGSSFQKACLGVESKAGEGCKTAPEAFQCPKAQSTQHGKSYFDVKILELQQTFSIANPLNYNSCRQCGVALP